MRCRRTGRLIVLDVEHLLCYIAPYSRVMAASTGIRVDNNFVFPRPHLHEFLKFCFEKFDVGIWSSLEKNQLERILASIFTRIELNSLKHIWDESHCLNVSDSRSSNQRFFVKSFDMVEKYTKDYHVGDMILIDTDPYHTCLDVVVSSLYPPKFLGSSDDHFLLGVLIPYLEKLANSSEYLALANWEKYPDWSVRSLRRDWKYNHRIWENPDIQRCGDRYLIRNFNKSRVQASVYPNFGGYNSFL